MDINIRIVNASFENQKLLRKNEVFKENIKRVLRENAVGTCYDMIETSLPMPKGRYIDGGTTAAFARGLSNYQATVESAFKPITSKPLAFWILNNDQESVRAYLKKDVNLQNKRYSKWLREGRWDELFHMFWKSSKVQPEYNTQVVDNATLGVLHEWRKKEDKQPIYVRNIETVRSLANANNQVKVGWMAGGWLICALKLGRKPDKYTKQRLPTWMYHKGIGVAKVSRGGMQINIENEFANFGGWMYTDGVRRKLVLRANIIAKCAIDIVHIFTEPDYSI